MKQFHLTVNGQTLTFSEGQIPEVQSAFQEAVKNPGDQAVRVSQFGETRARMDGAEVTKQTIDGAPRGTKSMVNSNVQLTDC